MLISLSSTRSTVSGQEDGWVDIECCDGVAASAEVTEDGMLAAPAASGSSTELLRLLSSNDPEREGFASIDELSLDDLYTRLVELAEDSIGLHFVAPRLSLAIEVADRGLSSICDVELRSDAIARSSFRGPMG